MKEKRDKFFKKERPTIRLLGLKEGNAYHTDLGILWTAHKKTPFVWMDKNLNQINFATRIEEISQGESLMIAEDFNKNFKSGKGPVCLISVQTKDNWKYEPHAQFFPWATTRNKLRVAISFFQWIRYQRSVGACVVYALSDSINLFDKCCEYGVLHRVGKIVNGDSRGDEVLYSIRGKKCPSK